jgi:hypothetical protein
LDVLLATPLDPGQHREWKVRVCVVVWQHPGGEQPPVSRYLTLADLDQPIAAMSRNTNSPKRGWLNVSCKATEALRGMTKRLAMIGRASGCVGAGDRDNPSPWPGGWRAGTAT